MADVQIPGLPDVAGKAVSEDPQLAALLIAIKLTLETLTGADPKSNKSLIAYLNANQ